MALSLGLQLNSPDGNDRAFYIGDTLVSLEDVTHPMKFRLRVHGAIDKIVEVTDRRREEILPNVFVSAGLGNEDQVKVSIEAPRNIKILRDRLYREAHA